MLPLLLTLLLHVPAFAQMDGLTRQAEYDRLGHEMRSRAQRNAWDGVERSYLALLETNIPLSAEQHYYGAQAAQAAGDVSSSRERVLRALEVAELQEYKDLIHRIDMTYGPVSLKGDPGRVGLSVEQLPFDPGQAAAVQFAQRKVEETGAFEGLLPAGAYTFGTLSLKVRPGVHTERIDVRTDRYMRKLDRLERKE